MHSKSYVDKLKCKGAEEYCTFKDLVQKHGRENAEKLRTAKKMAQSTSGDAYPDLPHWFTHPDFGDLEVTGRQYYACVLQSGI